MKFNENPLNGSRLVTRQRWTEGEILRGAPQRCPLCHIIFNNISKSQCYLKGSDILFICVAGTSNQRLSESKDGRKITDALLNWFGHLTLRTGSRWAVRTRCYPSSTLCLHRLVIESPVVIRTRITGTNLTSEWKIDIWLMPFHYRIQLI